MGSRLGQETIATVLRNSGAVAVLSLQPRRFPLAAALEEPHKVSNFIRSFSAESDGEWGLVVNHAVAEVVEEFGAEATENLVVATVTPPGARPDQATRGVLGPDWRPLRHRLEIISQDTTDSLSDPLAVPRLDL